MKFETVSDFLTGPSRRPQGEAQRAAGGCLDSITQATSVPCTIQEKETEIWEKTHDTENIN